jgi:zinc and cadmium transporter
MYLCIQTQVMEELSLFTTVLVLFGVALLGGAMMFFGVKITPVRMKLLLSYSAAYLLALTFLHLLPEAMEDGGHAVGVMILIGFLLQIILDYFSQGVEHGHAHAHDHGVGKKFIWMVSISLWIHAFIEGMPFGARAEDHIGHLHEHHHEHSLLWGITLHKFTESFVFAALLIQVVNKKSRAIIWLVLFAMVAPLGALMYHYTDGLSFLQQENSLSLVTALLIGIILHVSTTILFESEEGHRFNRMKFLFILLGILSASFL